MFRIFTDVGQLVTQVVPPWALPVVIGGLLLALSPAWLESVRSKQIKGAVRRSVRATDTERTALFERALGLAGSRKLRLIGLVQEAIRYNQNGLRDTALQRLQAIPGGQAHAAALRTRIDKVRHRYRDPVEAAVRIEALLEDGLVVAAAEELELALRRFPTDPELTALQQRASQEA